MGHPRAVDVCILSWNRPAMALDAVASVLHQSGVDVRVVVVDQGSRPDEVAALRAGLPRDGRVRLVELDRNLGVPGGRNRAAAEGTSPYVMFLDDDAVLDDDTTLRRAVEHLEAHPETAVASLRVLDDATGDDDERSFTFPRSLRARSDEVHRVAKFLGGAAIVRRAVFDDLGGLDDDLFFGGEELELSFRVIGAGHAIDYLGPVRVRHRPPATANVTWSGERYYWFVRNGTYVWEKYLPSRLGVPARAVGWLVQAARARRIGKALRGLRDARRMLRALSPEQRDAARLSPTARDYVQRHQLDHEGGWVERARLVLNRR